MVKLLITLAMMWQKDNYNGIDTNKGIQIFESNPEGRLGFLDNVIGLYVYKYWPNGYSVRYYLGLEIDNQIYFLFE